MTPKQRSRARVVQALYQWLVSGDDLAEIEKQFLNMKFYEKLGPYQKKEDLEKKKDINPNVARNWVITWYSIVAASIILYLVISNI